MAAGQMVAYDSNGNPRTFAVGEPVPPGYYADRDKAMAQGAATQSAQARADLSADYDRGYDRGKKEFYDDPDMQMLRERNEDLSKGYSGAELGAKRAEARNEVQGQRSNYLRQLQSRVGRAGIGGARAAAMQAGADKGFQESNANAERKILLDDANLTRQGTSNLQDFIFRQKYGTLGSAIGEQQAGLAERGKYAAAAANNQDGGGMSWICTEVHKHDKWTLGEWRSLKKLERHARTKDPINAEMYFSDCGKLIENMKSKDYDFLSLKKTLLSIIELIKIGKIEAAYSIYKIMTIGLVATYGVGNDR